MKHTTLLTVSSVLAALLFALHWAQDVVLGLDAVGPQSFTMVVILLVWLSMALLLAERRAGQVVLLILGFLSAGVTALHLNGRRIAEVAQADIGLQFLVTLVLLGAAGALSFVLAALALWRSFRTAKGASGVNG
jgi:hypothetical protein